MTLAARLIIAFGFVAVLATALVGASVRRASRDIIEGDFDSRIEAAASGVSQELGWEAEALRGLLAPLCEHDTFVDKAHLALDRAKGDLRAVDPGSLISIRYAVPDQARALRLDDLVLVAGDGSILGATDVGRIGVRDPRLAALLKQPPGAPSLRPRSAGSEPSMEVHCARSSNGVTVGLVGARRIASILNRIGRAYRLTLTVADPAAPVPPSGEDVAVRAIDFTVVSGLKVVASVPRDELRAAQATLDRNILFTGAAAIAVALGIALVLSRSLSRPIAALAHETREVVTGEPKHVRGHGGREIAALAEAFNKTIDELTAMRKRLAATERIAARREVARQIAHEIKNPLAPIRAAVETLRRLRMRDNPAFDEYFEEATSTVLGEVHRIANIVTEFTRFNRMPPPNPEPIDLVQVARGVVTLHASAPDGAAVTGSPRVELAAEPIPMVSADRDQIIQVLTNLIQNGLDAAGAVRPDPRVTVTIGPLANERVRVVVRDNGPGVPEEFLSRLFEPYATTKEKGTGLGLAIVQRIVFEHGGGDHLPKGAEGGGRLRDHAARGGPAAPGAAAVVRGHGEAADHAAGRVGARIAAGRERGAGSAVRAPRPTGDGARRARTSTLVRRCARRRLQTSAHTCARAAVRAKGGDRIHMKPGQNQASSETTNAPSGAAKPCLEVMILWGTSVLHVEHQSPPRSFSVGAGEAAGEAGYAQLAVPALGEARVPVVIAGDDGAVSLVLPEGADGWIEIAGVRRSAREIAACAEACAALEGAKQIAFPLGSKARIEVFGLVLSVSSTVATPSPAKRWHFEKKHVPYVIGSAVLQLGLLGALYNYRAPLPVATSEVSEDQRYQIQVALQAAAEKEQEERTAEQVAEGNADNKEGGTGTRARGEEGSMGNPSARATSHRYGVQGPGDDPHIARQAALRDSAEFGMIGLLNSGSGGDPNAPTAPWGRDDSLGNDPLGARGTAMGGGGIGDAYGSGGLGLTGIGTIGHGAGTGTGQGFGSGAGRLGGSHQVAGNAAPATTPVLPSAPAESPIDPNGRFATTYRPGGGHLAAFESAVARGIIPAAAREVVSDVGARYAPAVDVASGKALGLRVDLERGKIAPSGGPVHLRLALKSSAVAPAARPHLSVHLVLDISGSMAGESIARAREAASAMVDRLAPTDDFSLTTFSSSAAVRVPDGPVGSRRADIKQTISGIGVEGGTNIGAGLSLGYEQASSRSIPEDAVRVVLLLSDGKANEGITSSDRLSRLALDAFQHGIQTSALGLGSDYDGALMSSIANDGAGGYYYLKSPDQIAPALATELDKRLDPVATAVEVRVRLKKDVNLLRVYGSRRLNDAEAARVRAVEVAADQQAQKRDKIVQNRQDDAEGGMRFFFPAFACDDAHALLLKLSVPAGANGRPIALVELKYKDRIGKRNVIEEIPVEAQYGDSDAASGATIDASVARTIQGFAAGEALTDAAFRIANGDRAGAIALLTERETILRQAAQTLNEPLFLRDADRLARLRGDAGQDSGLGEPLVLSMLLETAGRAHLR
ncbi:MAG: VWA domain-containing protein [Minicystis sp.]